MQRTFAEIDSSNLLVVDLTEKGVGLGIKAGYAYAKQIPIVVIARKGSDISATLQGIARKLFLYEKFEDFTYFFKGTTSLDFGTNPRVKRIPLDNREVKYLCIESEATHALSCVANNRPNLIIRARLA